jgi:catechol 2,3-dioxygenase
VEASSIFLVRPPPHRGTGPARAVAPGMKASLAPFSAHMKTSAEPDAPAAPYTVPAGTSIGHVHLKVADLERALAFYRDVLGFELIARYGSQAAFVSAGGYHHHIGLNTWESRGGTPPPPGHTGLYHTAIRYPTRADLAAAVRRVIAAGVSLQGAADHGVSEAVYLADPDDNGVELYWDRPRELWPRTPEGDLAMRTDPLDLAALLRTPPPI